MKYLLMICQDEKIAWSLSKEEMKQILDEYQALTEELKSKGNLIWGSALQPSSSATTVKVRDGKMSVTDGPFAETKEKMGGVFVVEAKDLNAAIQIAERIPSARLGSIEVRPLAIGSF